MAVSFYQVTTDRSRNGRKLSEGKFRLDNRKNLFTEGVFKHWKRFPSKVVVPPSLEVFKSWVEVALRRRVYWQPWQFWVHGCGLDLKGHFQTKQCHNLNSSSMLHFCGGEQNLILNLKAQFLIQIKPVMGKYFNIKRNITF